ncbi:MAG: right-handed parallel beta-helix repeat-containing protein [Planctomycetota bacterium]
MLRSFTVAALALALAPLAATQSTWYVDDDNSPGPGSGTPDDPFCRIQSAIEAAAEGDTVLVLPGTYVETINYLNKEIMVRSRDGAAVTKIDANATGPVVWVDLPEEKSPVLDGFTVTNGITLQPEHDGAGIFWRGGGAITNNIVRLNRDTGNGLAGGICCRGPVLVEGNVITENESYRSTAGLHGRGAVIRNNKITNNSAENGTGGVSCSEGIVERNVVTLNRTTVGPGGVACSNATLTGNVIMANSTEGNISPAGALFDGSGSITDNVIARNENLGNGIGGISVSPNASVTIARNIICGNVGRGIWCWGTDSVTITSSVIASNTSTCQGGGVCCQECAPLIDGNAIIANWSDSGGGGIASVGSTVGASPTVRNTILWENDSPRGKEIWVWASSSLSIAYSDVRGGEDSVRVEEGGTLEWGPGMIDADPLFADPSRDDYRVQRGSPCIDAGDPDSQPCAETDLDGVPRLLDGLLDRTMRIDMGAYEFDNVHLAVAGRARPGETLTFTTSGTPGLLVWLLAGTQTGATCWQPFGTLFFDLAHPWWLLFWGGIPAPGSYDVFVTIPPDIEPPLTLTLQELALDLGNGAGNLSNATLFALEP